MELDHVALAKGLCNVRNRAALSALAVKTSSIERLLQYPHLAKRKRVDLAKRVGALLESSKWNIEQASNAAARPDEIERQLAAGNERFFASTAARAIDAVMIARAFSDDVDVTRALAYAAQAYLVGERLSKHGLGGDYWNAVAAAILSETVIDSYRAWWHLVRTHAVQPFKALCDGLLGNTSSDVRATADTKVYVDGHRASLHALAALARGEDATTYAAEIGACYATLAAHRGKGSTDAAQFVDLVGSATVALVTRAGGNVPAQPYLL